MKEEKVFDIYMVDDKLSRYEMLIVKDEYTDRSNKIPFSKGKIITKRYKYILFESKGGKSFFRFLKNSFIPPTYYILEFKEKNEKEIKYWIIASIAYYSPTGKKEAFDIATRIIQNENPWNYIKKFQRDEIRILI